MKLNEQIAGLQDELITSVQEIIKIRSVEEPALPGMPYGKGVADALAYALNLAEKMGFKTVNLDGYAGYAEFGGEGSNGDDYIAVLGHLDVVPEENGWQYPPYGAEIHDGKIYGRGAVDDKGPTIAALYALKAIKDLGLKLSKKVRIIFGTNEESGCDDMIYYLTKEKPPIMGFTPDGEYPVIQGEKGILHFNIIKSFAQKTATRLTYLSAGQRLNIVPDYCEARIATPYPQEVIDACVAYDKKSPSTMFETASADGEVVLKSYGKAAHGSTPELGINAIMQMCGFLKEINLGNQEISASIEFLSKHIGKETTGVALGIGLKDEPSGNLSFNVGKVELREGQIIFGCDVRYPVTFKTNDVVIPLTKKLATKGMTVEVLDGHEPLYFPLDHPLVKTLHEVFEEHSGLTGKPKCIGGGTYAKVLPNTVAYGTILPGKPHLEHQANEYLEIEDLIIDAKIYAHVIYELAK
jgi:succinyl-diaminopimelate desuccinylase